jgi:hydroxymethylpyrimidine pyrophosphatase-like HAD family hydrolase
MDGTLLPSGGDFAESDLRALDRLGEMGVTRVIATGRSPFSFNRMMGDREIPVDYLVLSSGAAIVDYRTGEYLRTVYIDAPSARGLVEKIAEIFPDFCIQHAVPQSHVFHFVYSSGSNPDLQRRIELYRDHCSPLEGMEQVGVTTQVVIIVPRSQWNSGLLQKTMHVIGPEFSLLRTTSPLDGRSIWIEVFPRNVSKSSGVEWLSKRLGIPREAVAAVGNDYNDHDLLKWAGHAFVVADSPEHMRSTFIEVAPVGKGGVTEAVERWLKEMGQPMGDNGWPSS